MLTGLSLKSMKFEEDIENLLTYQNKINCRFYRCFFIELGTPLSKIDKSEKIY